MRHRPLYADLDDAVRRAFILATKGLFKGKTTFYADVIEAYLAMIGVDDTDEYMGLAVLHLSGEDKRNVRLEFLEHETDVTHA